MVEDILYLHRAISHHAFPLPVRSRGEEPGRPWPDASVLRPSSWEPGVRGHLTSTRLPQRQQLPGLDAHPQHEPPQP